MVTSETAFGGYAESIIQDPEEYDGLEIHGVSEEPDSFGSTVCEVDDENPQFFSVYAHLRQGGVECIGDFLTRDYAQAYAETIAAQHGWPIDN